MRDVVLKCERCGHEHTHTPMDGATLYGMSMDEIRDLRRWRQEECGLPEGYYNEIERLKKQVAAGRGAAELVLQKHRGLLTSLSWWREVIAECREAGLLEAE